MKNQLKDLSLFTGSETWYRHGINRNVLFTDGAKYVADQAEAYWLLDEIALVQPCEPALQNAAFQVWRLTVKADSTATLTCEDGDGETIYTKEIEFTDFPQEGIKFYLCDNTILLPSEY